jgi:hypothetical protein
MIKIVSGPADTRGFNQNEFFRIYEAEGDDGKLAALASSSSEAHDAQEMLFDLTGRTYYIVSPAALAN